jgi:hypothetical protein
MFSAITVVLLAVTAFSLHKCPSSISRRHRDPKVTEDSFDRQRPTGDTSPRYFRRYFQRYFQRHLSNDTFNTHHTFNPELSKPMIDQSQ